jgi:hypothetical protein
MKIEQLKNIIKSDILNNYEIQSKLKLLNIKDTDKTIDSLMGNTEFNKHLSSIVDDINILTDVSKYFNTNQDELKILEGFKDIIINTFIKELNNLI